MKPLTRKEPIIKRPLSTKTPKVVKARDLLTVPEVEQIQDYIAQFVLEGTVKIGLVTDKRLCKDELECSVDSICIQMRRKDVLKTIKAGGVYACKGLMAKSKQFIVKSLTYRAVKISDRIERSLTVQIMPVASYSVWKQD